MFKIQQKTKDNMVRKLLSWVGRILPNSRVRSRMPVLFSNKIIRLLILHNTYMQLPAHEKTRQTSKNTVMRTIKSKLPLLKMDISIHFTTTVPTLRNMTSWSTISFSNLLHLRASITWSSKGSGCKIYWWCKDSKKCWSVSSSMDPTWMASDSTLIIISLRLISSWPIIFSSSAWPTFYRSLFCSCSLFISLLHWRSRQRICGRRLRLACSLSFECPLHHSSASMRS